MCQETWYNTMRNHNYSSDKEKIPFKTTFFEWLGLKNMSYMPFWMTEKQNSFDMGSNFSFLLISLSQEKTIWNRKNEIVPWLFLVAISKDEKYLIHIVNVKGLLNDGFWWTIIFTDQEKKEFKVGLLPHPFSW